MLPPTVRILCRHYGLDPETVELEHIDKVSRTRHGRRPRQGARVLVCASRDPAVKRDLLALGYGHRGTAEADYYWMAGR